jgi:hypothetical protein
MDFARDRTALPAWARWVKRCSLIKKSSAPFAKKGTYPKKFTDKQPDQPIPQQKSGIVGTELVCPIKNFLIKKNGFFSFL